MRAPNLIIPGFPKSGTSALHSALVQHQEISDGGVKEPHTYSWGNRFKNRKSTFFNLYQSLKGRYILDSSTSYLVSMYAIERIFNDTPNAKFIIVARDPVDRIVSHYNWLSSIGLVNRSPINEIEFHLKNKFDYRRHYRGNYKAYINFSLYGEQMQHLLQVVDSQNVLFIKYEELFADFERYRVLLERFLDLDLSNITVRRVNATSFNNIVKNHNPDLIRRILNRIRYEYKIMKGYPRSLKVKKPQQFRTSREEIEEIVIPYLKSDLLLLESLGFNIEGWPTYKMIGE